MESRREFGRASEGDRARRGSFRGLGRIVVPYCSWIKCIGLSVEEDDGLAWFGGSVGVVVF